MKSEFLLSSFEELRIACNKKFADKNETAKNIKYLDTQVQSSSLFRSKILKFTLRKWIKVKIGS